MPSFPTLEGHNLWIVVMSVQERISIPPAKGQPLLLAQGQHGGPVSLAI